MYILSELFSRIHRLNCPAYRHINTKLINYYAINPALLMTALIASFLFCQEIQIIKNFKPMQ